MTDDCEDIEVAAASAVDGSGADIASGTDDENSRHFEVCFVKF